MRRILAIGLLIASNALLIPAAHAALVTFNFSSSAANWYDGNLQTVALQGTLTYDTSSINGLLTGSISANGNTWTLTSKPATIAGLNSIYVYNNAGNPPFDAVTFYGGISGPNMQVGTDTWMPSYVVLTFGNDPNVLNSTAIPGEPTILNAFSSRSVNLQFQRLDSNGIPVSAYTGLVWANDVMVAPVPLPAAAWLLLSGLGGLGFIGRRRRTH